MTSLKRGAKFASTLMLMVVLLSACNKPYSDTTAATFTPLPNSVFGTVGPTSALGPIESFATGSAVAQLTTTPSTPAAGASATTAAGVTPQPQVATPTNTALVPLNPTATLALPSAATTTPVPVTAGGTYVLKPGEFPYCIARRFNVDPTDMLQLSGLSDGVLYDPGTVLKIPTSGTFPGPRMLKTHPASYTVLTANETVYSIACQFGDVDPDAIARANNIPVGSTTPIPVNTVLNIP